MAAINDLINQITDVALRERVQKEVNKLSKQKKFGLVFEEHLPECTPLYDMPIKRGCNVILRDSKEDKSIYIVGKVEEDTAVCVKREAPDEAVTFALGDIVRVAEFGEAIYPYLKLIDSVCNAQDSDLWHTLIEADNYHALQLLEYLYAGKADCIYIDPPYNTGAKDWKYNNDYVDGNDAYRHSKWLSFIEKRLKLAKHLLNPKKSVLIVTIDEKECMHLGCLLEDMFPEARIQMISTSINPAVVARVGGFGRSGEYIFFLFFGESAPVRLKLEREWVSSRGRTHTGQIRWDLLKRSGTGASRQDSPGGFYPVYIDPQNNKIVKIGSPLPEGVSEAQQIEGLFCLLPIRDNGTEGRWQWTAETFSERMKQGRVRVGGNSDRGYTIYILKDGEYSKILNGEFTEIGRGINNEIIVNDIDTDHVLAIPGDIWQISSHDATQYGSRLLSNIFNGKRFTFPKSLYAVKDAIRFVTSNQPDALVVDFFAGSGTTLHAVNLLNAEDGGRRRCIMVTNNEVSETERKELIKKGYRPGDEEWERLGIARYVTWPRTVCSIKGIDIKGNPLKGKYLGLDVPMSQGFMTNANFFKLGFLDKTAIALGTKLKEMLPVLWMKAGAVGKCPQIECDIQDILLFPENKFAVLANENAYAEFAERMVGHPEIQTVFINTDYEGNYRAMAKDLNVRKTYQLYRDYLDHFRITHGRN